MTELSTSRAQELVSTFAARRPLVVGDLMLDEYLFGDVRRISPEAPVPIVHLKRESYRLGGAGNVAANASALGARPLLIGTIGKDAAGRLLLEQAAAHSIDASRLVTLADRPTTQKTRIIAHNQQIVRCDREDPREIDGSDEASLIAACLESLPAADAVIVSDYGKGCLTTRVLAALLAAARERSLPVVVDPAARRLDCYQPVTVLTPNHHEAAAAAGVFDTGDDAQVVLAGRNILERVDAQCLVITRGEAGMTLFERRDGTDARVTHIPTVAREVFDVSGAGDTVSTLFGLALASGASPVEAAMLANQAAGVVVGKVGTATTSAAELLGSLQRG